MIVMIFFLNICRFVVGRWLRNSQLSLRLPVARGLVRVRLPGGLPAGGRRALPDGAGRRAAAGRHRRRAGLPAERPVQGRRDRQRPRLQRGLLQLQSECSYFNHFATTVK